MSGLSVGSLNCAAFVAGIIEAVLDGYNFVSITAFHNISEVLPVCPATLCHFPSPHRPSSLSCINEYLVIDGDGNNVNEWSSRNNCSVAECFPGKPSWCRNEQVCRGVTCKALWAVQWNGYCVIWKHTFIFTLFYLSTPNDLNGWIVGYLERIIYRLSTVKKFLHISLEVVHYQHRTKFSVRLYTPTPFFDHQMYQVFWDNYRLSRHIFCYSQPRLPLTVTKAQHSWWSLTRPSLLVTRQWKADSHGNNHS